MKGSTELGLCSFQIVLFIITSIILSISHCYGFLQKNVNIPISMIKDTRMEATNKYVVLPMRSPEHFQVRFKAARQGNKAFIGTR